jgi:ribosomal protein S17E
MPLAITNVESDGYIAQRNKRIQSTETSSRRSKRNELQGYVTHVRQLIIERRKWQKYSCHNQERQQTFPLVYNLYRALVEWLASWRKQCPA